MRAEFAGTNKAAADLYFADLRDALQGDFNRFATGLVSESATSVGVDCLLDDAMRDAITERFDARFGRTDPRAVFSIWASAYFMLALPPLLTGIVLLNRRPSLDLDRVGFVIAPDLRVQALHVSGDISTLEPTDVDGPFDHLVRAHLTPLIDHLACRSLVTTRVLWSNAGNVFEAFLRKIENLAAGRPSLAHANTLLARASCADGSRNPLYSPVRYADRQRIRRICCLRFLVPDGKICTVCPLPTNTPARSRWVHA